MSHTISEIEATNQKKWIVIMAGAVLPILLAFFWKEETLSFTNRIAIFCACVLLLLYAFCHAVYSATMNDVGVSCSCFGKARQRIPWEQIGEIAITRDYRLNLGTSGNTRIIVVPKGCPTSDIRKLGGVPYFLRFRKQVIWMDNTEINREFIKKVWGELADYR